MAVRPDGSYVSLDETRRTALEALRVTGQETVFIKVMAVDGSDDDVTQTTTTMLSVLEDEFSTRVSPEAREASLSEVEDDDPELAGILRELSEYHD